MAIVAQGQAASGLDVFIRFQGSLTDPINGPTYVITEPAGTTVGTGSGFRRSVGHFDARDTVIPSGFSITEAWKIEWTATSPAGITSSACEEFSVVASLDFLFNNTSDITDLVKLDLGLTNEFTDVEFNDFVNKAVKRVNRKLCLTGTSDQMVFDEGTGIITPAPNDTKLDIIVLQIECFVVTRDRKTAVGKGIKVKDGETSIDTTASFGGFNQQVRTICGELDEAVSEFLRKADKASFSDTVSENAEVIWYGNSRICEPLRHDGQGHGEERCNASPYEFTLNL